MNAICISLAALTFAAIASEPCLGLAIPSAEKVGFGRLGNGEFRWIDQMDPCLLPTEEGRTSLSWDRFLLAQVDSPAKPLPPVNAESPPSEELSPVERDILAATNSERKKANLPPLKLDPLLLKMAREQSRLMAEARMISHAVGGQTFPLRLKASRYPSRTAGENCAEGQETPAETVAGWMNSPGHKANILNPDFQDLGVALSVSADGRKYFTQVFGRRRDPQPSAPLP